jgi:aspartyl-tRNA(Asn)/glutamyl-tRNA(Gln) amidotransferase subunit A
MTKTSAELQELSLAEASRLVESRDISPIELVEASLERIAAVNGKINAYISVYEEARAVAKAAEAMIGASHWLGPLHGIPIALKDNIGLKGLCTTAASKVLADWVPERDATIAVRLRGQGAIFVGKTNMHEFAWGGTSDNPHFGAVRNAWNVDRFPAGSSGGSGAAVAAPVPARPPSALTPAARCACRRPSTASSASGRPSAGSVISA